MTKHFAIPLPSSATFPAIRAWAPRELKFALERHWRGEIDEAALQAVGRQLRARHWEQQRDAGLDFVSVGDFAFYDQVANHIQLLGCEPARYGFSASSRTEPLFPHGARADSRAARPLLPIPSHAAAAASASMAGRCARCRRRAGNEQMVRHQLPLPVPEFSAETAFRWPAAPVR
jgi:5-methyltetrahydropteroyltriglutamate--homocysteine methyltransferase